MVLNLSRNPVDIKPCELEINKSCRPKQRGLRNQQKFASKFWTTQGISAASAIASIAALLCNSATFSDPLPKSAQPMTTEAVTLMYSGNTAVWQDSDIYFSPDGSVKGILGKPTAKAAIEGSWSVNENKICVYTFRSKQPGSFYECYQWWRDGKRAISSWSPRSDGSTADATNGFRFGEEKSLKAGDLVSNRYSSAPGF
jgi:Protein of unknown function (DUF995)